jgi:hypothetical protein
MLPDIFARSNGGFLDFVFFGSKCCGKLKVVGTAPSRKRVVCPVLSKHAGSKCSEHRDDELLGFHPSRLTFRVHCCRNSALLGKLQHT